MDGNSRVHDTGVLLTGPLTTLIVENSLDYTYTTNSTIQNKYISVQNKRITTYNTRVATVPTQSRISNSSSRAGMTTSGGNKIIDIDEELSKLQPSERLLEFYREKIAKLKLESQQMHHLLDRYKENLGPTFGEKERQKLTRELIELRSALSDVNVFIHAERQQVTRLYAENERLQLDNLEAEKKVAMLLSLSGLTEGELHVYLRDPRRTTIVQQRLPPHLRKLHCKLKKDASEPELSETEVILKTQVAHLKKQLEESDKNWQMEKNALLQDRVLSTSESKAQAAKDEAHITLLTARLEEAQRLLSEAMKDTLEKTSRMQDVEIKWLAERDHLLSVLAAVQNNVSFLSHMQSIERSGSYTDLSKAKSTCELKDLRRENESLKV
ncbi:hypothetical protein Pcinc_024134 [Petrolisthes cinctipes]|uniref:Uncharacterized protein n=1 Tax=Petrolisthes cinctipes TaxID=88211 RepID=A0AAE1KB83_PETCI|nr:hypothetical protein Pcinc_024134 [Petrolisthes cinctipes]